MLLLHEHRRHLEGGGVDERVEHVVLELGLRLDAALFQHALADVGAQRVHGVQPGHGLREGIVQIRQARLADASPRRR